MTKTQDQRSHDRMDMIFKVDYTKSEDFVADYASNASDGGVFIATEKPFVIGDRLTFEISFPGLLSPILCQGEVRWCRTPDQATEEEPVGVGIAFVFENEEQETQIKELIQGLTEAPKEPVARTPFGILLVEPDPEARQVYGSFLRAFHHLSQGFRMGLRVDEAENKQQALEILTGRDNQADAPSFNLAVVDMQLPEKGGEQLIRDIRSRQPSNQLPIIAIGDGTEDSKKGAYQAGADLYFGRPIGMNHLFESLQRLIWLQQGQSQDEEQEEQAQP